MRDGSLSGDRLIRVVLPVAAILLFGSVVAVGWMTQPDRFARGYAPEQPIPFSHRLHAGLMKVPCLYCHTGTARSRYAGVPPVETCRNCHRVTKTESPAIKTLLGIAERGEPLPWKRIHRLPDHVDFDHRPHVGAGILCQTCHGEVQTFDVVRQTMSLRMSSCLGCHRDPAAALPGTTTIRRGPEHCWACHR